MDYLRVVREAERGAYADTEGNAWEQLRRRLHRNDELREQAAAPRA